MIEFLTLFLGIVAGPQEVALLVDDKVARIEIQVDGETLTAVEKPPWKAQIDLGTELLPHELTAIGFDDAGVEVARATQFLNIPRPAAEVSLMLRDAAEGRLEAEIAWESASGARPTGQIALLDEKEITILDGHRIDLGKIDLRQLHVLQVELWFADLSTARGHLVFGGEYVDETNAELTALPVLTAKGSPRVEEMERWFVAQGSAATVAAVEKGLASLVIVRGPGAIDRVRSLNGVPKSGRSGGSDGIGPIQARASASTADVQRSALELENDFRVRLVVPRALHTAGQRVDFDLFSVSPEIRPRQGGLFWILSLDVRVGGVPGQIRLQDAVTLAGLTAAGTNHRRAVLLILAEPEEDRSRFEPAVVRRYLESLNVPLFVWDLGDEAATAGWGPVTEISNYSDLNRAWRTLEKSLNKQRVIWLEGSHLPNAVEIAPAASVAPVVGDKRP